MDLACTKKKRLVRTTTTTTTTTKRKQNLDLMGQKEASNSEMGIDNENFAKWKIKIKF